MNYDQNLVHERLFKKKTLNSSAENPLSLGTYLNIVKITLFHNGKDKKHLKTLKFIYLGADFPHKYSTNEILCKET